MAGYIIDPLWFYWIHICDGIRGFLWIATFVCIIATFCLGMLLLIAYGELDDTEESKNLLKRIGFFTILSLCLSVIFGVINIFMPSKEVLIQMQLAKMATHENVEALMETIKNATDYILDGLK